MYPVPNFPGYTVDELGNVYKFSKLRKPTYKTKQGGRAKFNFNINGVKYTKALARVVLSAKLGRKLESYEDACHINGDPTDDRMVNLKVGDRLNNIIDEIESGRIETSVDYLDLAIERLEKLRKNKKIL